MKQPLNRYMRALLEKDPISLHVPGHKNNTIGHLAQLDWAMDMTEITGLDDLHQPEGVIKESMQGLSKHEDYEAFYLVNGTTSGILAVIQAFANQDGEYLIARNAHKSVFHGLEINQASAALTKMELSDATHQYVTPQLSERILSNKKLAVFTYPNYYGETFDIESTIERCKSSSVPTLIDEAHGAHFDLAGFPRSALNYSADYVVQSYHKTLPSLTMSSVLFIHKDAPLRHLVRRYLTFYQSSSPSYLLMTSLEAAHHFYQTYESTMFFKKREKLIQQLKSRGFYIEEVEDPLKLNVSLRGYTGHEVQRIFEDEEVYCELADDQQMLLILPLWHEGDSFQFESLLSRIEKLKVEKRAPLSKRALNVRTQEGRFRPTLIRASKEVAIEKAEGAILASSIVPYPPGIPIMFKGEVITSNMLELLKQWSHSDFRVEGIVNDKIMIKDE
ncbi:lysine decarboxylase [Staphylococcus sp. SQ8-PEA]|uniref:Lysine decarboxylase n=1 Tax=Staphylococcus marylandisciuri TaxID=2981529 RepID=A0ABT2QSY4_9STAP|nr:lysine decarboxylase [Staphylococcus marylandisciuri]MCU5747062.1 lysine decarboxylase [Staphylococcus marylandisciuri]